MLCLGLSGAALLLHLKECGSRAYLPCPLQRKLYLFSPTPLVFLALTPKQRVLEQPPALHFH